MYTLSVSEPALTFKNEMVNKAATDPRLGSWKPDTEHTMHVG